MQALLSSQPFGLTRLSAGITLINPLEAKLLSKPNTCALVQAGKAIEPLPISALAADTSKAGAAAAAKLDDEVCYFEVTLRSSSSLDLHVCMAQPAHLSSAQCSAHILTYVINLISLCWFFFFREASIFALV